MIRIRARVPFAVLAVAVGGTWAVAQAPGVTDEMECRNCGHVWPLREGQATNKCPKCGIEFTRVVNPDGTTSDTGAKATAENPAKKIAFGIGAGVLVIAAVLAVIKLATGGGAKKGKKKKRPVQDEEDD